MEICTVQFIQYNSFIESDYLHRHAMFQEKSNRRTMFQVRCAPQRGKSKHKQTIIKWYEDYGKYMMDIVYPKTSLKGPFNFLTNSGQTSLESTPCPGMCSNRLTLHPKKQWKLNVQPWQPTMTCHPETFSLKRDVDKELNLQCQVLLILQKQPCLHGAGLPESGCCQYSTNLTHVFGCWFQEYQLTEMHRHMSSKQQIPMVSY